MLDEHRLKHHMIDEVDLLMEYNQDLSKEEAEFLIQKNREAMEDPHLMAMAGKTVEEEPELEEEVEELDE